MSLAHGILGFLSYRKLSGYDLAKAFSVSVQFFWNAQNSQIYLALDKLEKKKFVTHELVVQTDKPNKKLYSITDLGRAEFVRWLSDQKENVTADFKSAFLMKVFFSGNIPPEQSLAMLKKFIADCHTFIGHMNAIPNSIAQYRHGVSDYAVLYWQFTADFGYSYLKMCIEWAENCIKKLEELL